MTQWRIAACAACHGSQYLDATTWRCLWCGRETDTEPSKPRPAVEAPRPDLRASLAAWLSTSST